MGTDLAVLPGMIAKAALLCCLVAPVAWLPASHAQPASPPNVQIEMKNVRLHIADGIVLDIRSLRGVMVSRV